MSKFTKALEKIQVHKKRPEAAYSEKPSAVIALDELPGGSPERWFHTITEEKNVVPEHEVVPHHFSNSLIAEQYRMLKVNLRAHIDKDMAKVIMVSSAINGEGKSVTSVNLALTLAEDRDAKVALVDADLRRGSLAHYLGIKKDRNGLSEYLSNTNGMLPKKIMVRALKDNLIVIPRGAHTQHPSDLLCSTKFRVLIEELRSRFDFVIIDSPPIMSVADAGILGRETDGTLVVIQVGRTPKSIIAHSSALFKQAGVKVLGYVLTNVEYQSSDYRYDYGYRYDEYMDDAPGGKRKKIKLKLKKAEDNIDSFETRLNHWWEKNILKRK